MSTQRTQAVGSRTVLYVCISGMQKISLGGPSPARTPAYKRSDKLSRRSGWDAGGVVADGCGSARARVVLITRLVALAIERGTFFEIFAHDRRVWPAGVVSVRIAPGTPRNTARGAPLRVRCDRVLGWVVEDWSSSRIHCGRLHSDVTFGRGKHVAVAPGKHCQK